MKIFTHRFCLNDEFHNPRNEEGEHQESSSRGKVLIESLKESSARKRQKSEIVVIDTCTYADNEEECSHLMNTIEKSVLLVHEEEYLSKLKEVCNSLQQDEQEPLTPKLLSSKSFGSTKMGKYSYHTALAAISSCLAAANFVLSNEIETTTTNHPSTSFCLVRPPGHHAGRNGIEEKVGGCGFCLLNTVAIAAAEIQQKWSEENNTNLKIAVIDFDVHHGNGTEECLKYLGKNFFYGSTHLMEVFEHDSDSDFFPGTGGNETNTEDFDKCWIQNCPIIPLWVKKQEKKGKRKGRKAFVDAFENILIPSLKRFKPDLIFISAGFDGAKGDEGNLCFQGITSGLDLLPTDFETVTKMIVSTCPKVVSVLEGGYGTYDINIGKFNRESLIKCFQAHLRGLEV